MPSLPEYSRNSDEWYSPFGVGEARPSPENWRVRFLTNARQNQHPKKLPTPIPKLNKDSTRKHINKLFGRIKARVDHNCKQREQYQSTLHEVDGDGRRFKKNPAQVLEREFASDCTPPLQGGVTPCWEHSPQSLNFDTQANPRYNMVSPKGDHAIVGDAPKREIAWRS